MNALVFAAGLGTRLRPWTLEHPKALVPLAGEPVLGRVLRKLAASGLFGRVVVNVHHFPDQIREYLASRDFGIPVGISDESDLLLDTGGGLLRAIELLGGPGEPLLVHNADIFTDFPLAEMALAHTSSEADTTLLVARRPSSRQLLFDAEGRMRGWTNVAAGEILPPGLDAADFRQMAFGGVHILGPKAQEALVRYASETAPGPRPFGIMPFYIASCSALDIRAFTPSAPYRWFDIGSPEKLADAEKSFEQQ